MHLQTKTKEFRPFTKIYIFLLCILPRMSYLPNQEQSLASLRAVSSLYVPVFLPQYLLLQPPILLLLLLSMRNLSVNQGR